jgi:hypothetical protein
MIVEDKPLSEHAACLSFFFIRGCFDAEKGVDVGSCCFFRILYVFDLNGVVHHEEDAVSCLLLAKDAVVILNFIFRLPHYSYYY